MSTNFTDLPHEILTEIFHHLSSIDDVHHLGRTCTKAYHVIQRQKNYVKIMRSIIWQSPQHRYDLQLSRILELHRDIVHNLKNTTHQLPATRNNPNGYRLNLWEQGLLHSITAKEKNQKTCPSDLTDDVVYEILARYQGLRSLEAVWLRKQCDSGDLLQPDTLQGRRLAITYKLLLHHIDAAQDASTPRTKPDTPETEDYTEFNPDQRARFYSATVYVWLMNEIRWVLTNFSYPSSFDVQLEVLQTCTETLATQRHSPLLDELDQCAVFKFLYHYLLPLCAPHLADRDSHDLPFTFVASFGSNRAYRGRLLELFLHASQTHFQPPDLIDLLLRSTNARRPPWPHMAVPRSTHLHQRPSSALSFPSTPMFRAPGPSDMRDITRAATQCLNVIARSSVHQTRRTRSPVVDMPEYAELFNVRDHAAWYYADRAVAAFECGETKDPEKPGVRSVWQREWGRVFWSVWWWAGSGEKARAKMERWRDGDGEARGESEADEVHYW